MPLSASYRRSMPEGDPRHPPAQLGGTWMPAERAGSQWVAPQTNDPWERRPEGAWARFPSGAWNPM